MRKLGLLLVVLFGWSPAMAQTVLAGFVREDSTERRLAGVEVVIEGSNRRTLTDPSGKFVLGGLPIGSHLALFRLPGWRPLRIRADLVPGDTVWVDVMMIRQSVRLPEVSVTGEAVPEYLARAIDNGFLHRKRLGFGTFLTKDQIDAYFPLSTGDILRNIPGVKLMTSEGGTRVFFARCSERVGVWLNGVRIRAADHNQALALIHPKEVAAIEVYRGVAQIPGEFREDNCAAIVIWTH